MPMNRLLIKGGYGEHGRSCFLMPFQEDQYYMLDCGIMDTDPQPFPQIAPEVLKKTRYLFLSHCHKDHSGAFDYMCSHGFEGWLVTTAPTLEFTGITYDKTIVLECPGDLSSQTVSLPDEGLAVSYGRTGHCVGSIWLHVFTPTGSCFYSGDYQRRPLAYEVDPILDRTAGLAIVDCAHRDYNGDGDQLRKELADRIRGLIQEGHRVIMPLPKYGRGLELICMLEGDLAGIRTGADQTFVDLTRKMLSYSQWLKPEAVKTIRAFLRKKPEQILEKGDWNLLFLGDTHLEKPENSRLALQEAEQGARVLLTGRVKKGCCTETLYQEGKALVMAYPHHQSRTDFLETIDNNNFHMVLPFHNNIREVFWA